MESNSDYSSTNPRFVENPRRSRTQQTIDKAVVRNDTGNLQVYQCQGKIKTETVATANRVAFNRKTVGDLLNKQKMQKDILRIVRGE